MKKTVLPLLLFAVVLGASGCRDDREDMAQSLLDGFATGCASAGTWTRVALGQTDQLLGTLESLRTQDACAASSQTLQSIQTQLLQTRALLNNPYVDRVRRAEELVQELSAAIRDAQDAKTLDVLRGQLMGSQFELFSARAALSTDSFNLGLGRFQDTSLSIANYSNVLLGGNTAIANCIRQSPLAGIQIGSSLLGMAGSFISPVVGIASQVIGSLTQNAIEFARQSGFSELKFDLYSSKVPTAISCGLQGIAELFCSAQESQDLILYQVNKRPSESELPLGIWKAVDLRERKLPVLYQWLLKVRNGVTPYDHYDADRMTAAWGAIYGFYQTDPKNRTLIEEMTRKLSAQPDETPEKENLKLNELSGLVFQLSQSGSFSSLINHAHTLACAMVKGIEQIEQCPPPDTLQLPSPAGIAAYLTKNLSTDVKALTMNQLSLNYQKLASTTLDVIMREFNLKITIDSDALLMTVFQESSEEPSPFAVLQATRDFLIQMERRFGINAHELSLVQQTRGMVENVMSVLQDSSLSTADALKTVFTSFQLQDGLPFISSRMNDLIQQDVLDRIEDKDYPQDIKDLLWLAGSSVVERLSAAGMNHLDRINADLNSAQQISQSNLKNFRSLVSPLLVKAVENLYQHAVDAHEPTVGANRPNGQELGLLCLMWASTGEGWPSERVQQLCSTARYESVFQGRDVPFVVDMREWMPQLEKQPYRQRFCTFHQLIRKSRLREYMN